MIKLTKLEISCTKHIFYKHIHYLTNVGLNCWAKSISFDSCTCLFLCCNDPFPDCVYPCLCSVDLYPCCNDPDPCCDDSYLFPYYCDDPFRDCDDPFPDCDDPYLFPYYCACLYPDCVYFGYTLKKYEYIIPRKEIKINKRFPLFFGPYLFLLLLSCLSLSLLLLFSWSLE